ncbi:hypothetical protein T08_3443 [Trichinella sp. T8]|nr:hypothetical protein T08_3443 [Trichinella sp. T8]
MRNMKRTKYPASDYLNKVQKAFRSAVASHISKWFRNWELAKHLRNTSSASCLWHSALICLMRT